MVFYIYKIVGVNYIGSTNDIKKRTEYHKNDCWNKNCSRFNLLVYQYIREKNKNIQLEILFCYKGNCSNKIKRLVEQFFINKNDSVNNGLNTNYAFGVNIQKRKKRRKKKYKKYKEYNKQYNKKYKEKNKERLKQKINCPICNSLIRKYSLNRHQKSQKCKNAKLLLNIS